MVHSIRPVSDARGTDRGRTVQQSQAKDFADRVKYLTRDTAIEKQRMPENQRENADEQISSTPSSSSGNQSRKGHRTNQFENSNVLDAEKDDRW